MMSAPGGVLGGCMGQLSQQFLSPAQEGTARGEGTGLNKNLSAGVGRVRVPALTASVACQCGSCPASPWPSQWGSRTHGTPAWRQRPPQPLLLLAHLLHHLLRTMLPRSDSLQCAAGLGCDNLGLAKEPTLGAVRTEAETLSQQAAPEWCFPGTSLFPSPVPGMGASTA